MPYFRKTSCRAMVAALLPSSIKISPSSLDIHTSAAEASLPNPPTLGLGLDRRNPSPAANLTLRFRDESSASCGIDADQYCHHLHHNESAFSIGRTCADHHKAPTSLDTSCSCMSFEANKSIDIFLQRMRLLHDIQDQIRLLDATCNACSTAKLNAMDEHVASACVEAILHLLSNSAHTPLQRRQHLTAPMVIRTNKALELLNPITAESEASRTAALRHISVVIDTLGKKLLRVSEACTASAMAILITLCSKSDGAAIFRQAIATTGIPSKLVVVLQVASKDYTKKSAGRLLQLLHH